MIDFTTMTGPFADATLLEAGAMSVNSFAAAPWRAVTSLTLHADPDHLATNAAAGLAFGAILSRRTGLGVTVAVAVVGGAAGNALTAYACAPSCTWVGASTAVFAVMGAMCVAYRSVVMVAITVALCVAAHAADVNTAAHVCGAIAGVLVGLMVDREDKISTAGQLACALGAVAAVVASWGAALA